MIDSDRLIDIIEDRTLLGHVIDNICTALDNDTAMPSFIPLFHDSLLTDQITQIIEALQKNGKDE